jgi:pSer/pThr/pTyr-binding forkhead associated (FHA) protein
MIHLHNLMPYLQLASAKYPLLEGETRVGKGDAADVRLPSDADIGTIDLVITVRSDLSASVRRESGTSSIAINGITLGSEPSPLFHGDRLVVDGVALLFADESQAGMTTRVAAIGGEDAPKQSPRPARRGKSGGRMVSLIDGREYTVRAAGLAIGRDPGCDVVISAADVSRRHARIDLKPEGYTLVDLSTNGVLVNGARIQGAHPLSRGDVLRVGPEEFRFHADDAVAPEPEPPAPPIILATPPALATPPVLATPLPPPIVVPELELLDLSPEPPSPAVPTNQGRSASPGKPAPRPPSRRPPLATLEVVNEGPSRGARFELTTALTHVGRGEYNDVVIPDESVSDSHAKIQLRDAGWYVVDIDSTNGTYVSGRRVSGEARLEAGVDLRFGGVKLLFQAAQQPDAEGSGTRVIVRPREGTPKSPPLITPETEDVGAPVPPGEAGVPKVLLGGLLLLAFVVIFLILRTL